MSLYNFEDDNSLFNPDDVLGKVSQQPKNEFMPWHKPRKQYIRDKQWVEHLIRLVRLNKYKSVEVINYFGLPGGDLLDINYIYKGLQETSSYSGKKLGFHGFINNSDDYKKAQGELSKLLDKDDISKQSRLDYFNFEDLNKPNSEAWSRIKRFGTYHFINLDFCNNVLTEKTLPPIHLILEYQMQRVIGVPWLLCITTRLNRDSSNRNVIEKFHAVISEVMEGGAICEKIKECFSEAYDCMKSIDNIESAENKSLLNQILQICLVLWILKSAIARENKIELKSSFKYSVDLFNRECDMHSFVFSFEKEESILPDLINIVNAKNKAEPIVFDSVAMSAINRLSNSLDVDDYLDGQPDELEKYANQMMEMLKYCGYDVSDYKRYMNEKYGYSCILA
ncbi:PP_RS20740 family protein [Kluyvera ascorbata]|uniref:PP_RS20740 family protein n=1 Tax=Kluyvera ascorbata TaxID=51288 RepID=UPI002067DA89|nr:hypothetical protein [Kluyvera ascorbata]UPQ71167.1 hypothetical protein MY052_21020 [Kluyvera ascorbata]